MVAEATSYSKEQKALRQKVDGEAPLRDQIKIPEVNPDVYSDVLPMVFRGFLSVSAKINDVRFVLKTLNQHEFESLKWRGLEGSEFWDYFLAYSVLCVDGKNILRDRERWTDQIAYTFHDMPKEAKQKLVRHLSELNRRASGAVTLTEAYAMETYSRFRWGQLQGLDLSQPAVTGVVGTENLGLNWAQLVWRSLNYFEDMSQRVEREWENAKFVGSCFAGKGVQKVYNQDNERRKKEQEERTSRKERLIRHVFEGLPLDQDTTKDGRLLITAKTVEELADQVEKSLRGEKDFHDEVIEAWENRNRAQVEERRQDLQKLLERNEDIFQGRGVIGESSFEGLRPEEMAERMKRRKQYEAQARARMLTHPELVNPKVAEFNEKHYPPVNPGEVEPRVVPLVPQRDVGRPFRR